MKSAFAFRMAIMAAGVFAVAAPAAHADDAPSGHYAFAREDSAAALKAAGRSAEDIRVTLGMLRESSIDFTDDTVEIDLTAGLTVATCSWDVNGKDEIVLADCVDGDGKATSEGKPDHVDWMDDDSLEVYDTDGSKLIYRKQ